MSTVRYTSGGVLKITTPNGNSAWGVMLPTRPYMAFYRDGAVDVGAGKINQDPIFIIAVYNIAYKTGRWGKIETRIASETLPPVPPVFRQDALKPTVFTIQYPDGSSKKATPDECAGLERDAVWDAEHIEERIDDFYADRPNEFTGRHETRRVSS